MFNAVVAGEAAGYFAWGPLSREPMKAKFYEGELWKRELEAILMPMIERYDVVVVDGPAEMSLR